MFYTRRNMKRKEKRKVFKKKRKNMELITCICVERSTQNWSGQGESDCLIKTKHCDFWPGTVLTQCDFCPVL